MLLKMQVIGNLGRDASIKEVNGKKVINFSVAHTEKFKDKAGVTNERTTWVECGMWEKEGIAPYLKQGTLVHVEGSPSVTGFLTKANEPSASLKLNVFNLQLLGSKKEPGTPAPPATAGASVAQPAPGSTAPTEDDLPF